MLRTIIGITAAVLTMFGFVPQILKMWGTKSAKDISGLTLLQFSFGVTLWICYGLYLGDPIIIIANSITLSTLVVALFLFKKYSK